jgi:DNA-binding GntR family transcriptional regulator
VSEKILLPAEAIAQLARRRSRGIAQRRRALVADASDAVYAGTSLWRQSSWQFHGGLSTGSISTG